MVDQSEDTIKAVLVDYGGVLAEEGFREGLMAIARSNGLVPSAFFELAADAVYESGYVTGNAEESAYWSLVRERSGIGGSGAALRGEILRRFILRPWMVEIVRMLRSRGRIVSILSDQTDWLDELNDRDDFFKEFDSVFNSYHVGKGKRDPSLFTDVARTLDLPCAQILFIDDNEANVERARSRGLVTTLFKDREKLLKDLTSLGLL